MKQIIAFIKRETVLVITGVLAVVSMLFVCPDRRYISYIDFKTLTVLFSLMAIVAGCREIGVFDRVAAYLLSHVQRVRGLVICLVLLCFFLSMFITNDVALITFVPFTIAVMDRLDSQIRDRWMQKTVIMQTIAANLGSMLLPIGNPQNLYLYGKSGKTIGNFIGLLLPYSFVSFLLLIGWILIAAGKNNDKRTEENAIREAVTAFQKGKREVSQEEKRSFFCYLILFILCLLAVGHQISYWFPFGIILIYCILFHRTLLKKVDYSLLATFLFLFVFIGNIGRLPVFCALLQKLLAGREMIISVLTSQIMSNVPAAILLSGFTKEYDALLIGTNLGGLGTLIASMASLISFRYMAGSPKGKQGYVCRFTIANLAFLLVLLLVYGLMRVTA